MGDILVDRLKDFRRFFVSFVFQIGPGQISDGFGIIRMLVSDTQKAADVLSTAGYMCHSDSVAAIEIEDACGSLNRLLSAISAGNINIDYIYVTYSSLSKNPVAILRCSDLSEVELFLRSHGYNSLSRLD